MPLSRRTVLASLAVSGLAASLTGCNSSRATAPGAASSTTDSTTPGPDPANGGVDSAAFPVTINHKFGETVISSEPQRIVVAGLKEQDDLFALGLQPVAATKWLELPDRGIIGSWVKPQPTTADIQVLTTTSGYEFEKIASLAPDLILAIYGGLSEEDYTKLARLAPTVAQPAGLANYGVGWEQQARTVAQAVGRSSAMTSRINDIKTTLSDIRATHPDFANQSFAIATLYEGFYVYGSTDPRTRLITELGFTMPADLSELVGTKEFGANISAERLELLDTNLLIWLLSAGNEDATTLDDNTIYRQLRVAKQGRDLRIGGGTDLDNAFNFVTSLSLPYTIERLIPAVTNAIDGNPDN